MKIGQNLCWDTLTVQEHRKWKVCNMMEEIARRVVEGSKEGMAVCSFRNMRELF